MNNSINDFLIFLKRKSIEYRFLNMDFEDSNELSSDNDLLLKKSDFCNINNLINLFCQESNMRRIQEYRHSFFATNIILISRDNKKFLNLDFYYDLYYNGMKFENNELLFIDSVDFRERTNLLPKYDFAQYLIKKINKGGLSKLSFEKFLRLYNLDKTGCQTIIKKYIPHNNLINVFNSLNNQNFIKFQSSILEIEIPKNKFSVKLFTISNFSRIFSRILNPTGLSICFLGPDGSGKSSIISTLLSKQLPFRRHDYFHLTPLKPSNSLVEKPNIPSRNNEYPFIISFIKLIYYFFMYNISWLINIYPKKIQSSLVIFDRYYDDLLIDPARFRYKGSVKIIQFVKRIIPSPDIYFILTASPDIIFKRKQELSKKEILYQVNKYQKMKNNNVIQIDVNKSIEDITLTVYHEIISYMAVREKRSINDF